MISTERSIDVTPLSPNSGAEISDYHPHTRSGYRVQIEGTAPPIPAF